MVHDIALTYCGVLLGVGLLAFLQSFHGFFTYPLRKRTVAVSVMAIAAIGIVVLAGLRGTP